VLLVNLQGLRFDKVGYLLQFFIIDATTGSPREYIVEGTTFSPYGSVKSVDGKDACIEFKSEPMQRLAEISAICNDAKIVYNSVGSLCSRKSI
jgi:hypothetical protein